MFAVSAFVLPIESDVKVSLIRFLGGGLRVNKGTQTTLLVKALF
jgi:hypothetical protein